MKNNKIIIQTTKLSTNFPKTTKLSANNKFVKKKQIYLVWFVVFSF